MLSDFLRDNRNAVLSLTRRKTLLLSKTLPTTEALERGLSKFYENLIDVLERAPGSGPPPSTDVLSAITSDHGKEMSRLGYTVSQVVHGYGAICQSITEIAQAKGASIDPKEFNLFNYSLDVAIAESVTGFEEARSEVASRNETRRLGFLTHELRNALQSAFVAHELLKKGLVGHAGYTSAVLDQCLNRMHELIHRAVLDVKLRAEPLTELAPVNVRDAIGELEAAAFAQGGAKNVSLTVDVDPALIIRADRYHLIAALENLIQNAIKFSKAGGRVRVRGRKEPGTVVLEVEDACGGLPAGDTKDLFKPFTQKNSDRSGLGLGLAISRRATLLNGGELSARDFPGKGCVFSITLPMPAPTPGHAKRADSGSSAPRRKPRKSI